MNVVWLLPAVAILLAGWRQGDRLGLAGWAAVVAGLLLAGVPDGWLRAVTESIERRYIVGQLLCLAGLLALARSGGESEDPIL